MAAEAPLAPAPAGEARRPPPRGKQPLRRAELTTGRKDRPKEKPPLPSPSLSPAEAAPKPAAKKFVPPLW